jgi:hypothetical protein
MLNLADEGGCQMGRKIQLWRFLDANGDPLPPIPTAALHRMLCGQHPESMTCGHGLDYETQLEPGAMSGHFVLHRIRNRNLPFERRNGRIVPLNESVEELTEGSHFLFEARNLVLFMGTGFSPRPGRLAEWLRQRIGWDVWLQPVFRPDAGQMLANLRKVSKVQLTIPADNARRLDATSFFEDDDDPMRALGFAARAQQGGLINIGWSVGQGSDADQGFFQRLARRVARADLAGAGFKVAKADL